MPERFALYIGIDLGDKHCDVCALNDVCVLNQGGEFQEAFRLAMKATEPGAYFTSIARSRVAIEAGGSLSGWRMDRGLWASGLRSQYAQSAVYPTK
jgi:hypothetical protein